MDGTESVRMAWRSIRGHRLRSALTTLGVIIGIGAVITFVTLGASLEGAIIGDVAAGQSPSMTVTTQLESGQGGPGAPSDQQVFTEYDIEQIESLEGVETVVPQGSIPLSGVTYQNETVGLSSLTGTTPEYFEQTGQELLSR
ncbi:MAG: ABC transporter permease [Natrialbaceae archaeon]|nr:ABC transporter permease [Natrialbaceae archaeon]